MTIKKEIQLLERSALIELFILDSTNLPEGDILYFHAGTNKLSGPVVWQGKTYEPMPIQASGFDVTTQGALPRPKVQIANINGLLSAEVKKYDDFVGCKIIRKQTLAKFLDTINFPDGINSTADPSQFLPDQTWFVERKVTETRYSIEFELSSAMDLMGVQLPARQIIQNSCQWGYRSPQCGWSGGFFNTNNEPCSQGDDYCAKTLAACKVRFNSQGAPLRFGGFPGATRSAR